MTCWLALFYVGSICTGGRGGIIGMEQWRSKLEGQGLGVYDCFAVDGEDKEEKKA